MVLLRVLGSVGMGQPGLWSNRIGMLIKFCITVGVGVMVVWCRVLDDLGSVWCAAGMRGICVWARFKVL